MTNELYSIFQVECIKDGSQIATVVNHNFEKSEVRGTKSKSWTRKIEYNKVTYEQIAALVDHSQYCYQDIM